MWNPESFRKWQDFVSDWHFYNGLSQEDLEQLADRYGEINMKIYLAKYDIRFSRFPGLKRPLIYVLTE